MCWFFNPVILVKFFEINTKEILGGKYGEGDRWEVTYVSQMAKSAIDDALMSKEALTNLLNFKGGSEIMSNHMPLTVII
jgi:hypothetical protein